MYGICSREPDQPFCTITSPKTQLTPSNHHAIITDGLTLEELNRNSNIKINNCDSDRGMGDSVAVTRLHQSRQT